MAGWVAGEIDTLGRETKPRERMRGSGGWGGGQEGGGEGETVQERVGRGGIPQNFAMKYNLVSVPLFGDW